uniref:Nitrile hydratase accessory protein n=1 Tax=Streptomyces sp. NBC_00093 TaxID=2975649 RepID=A0AAU2AD51_9ACTN
MSTDMRPDAAELDNARRRVEALLCDLPGAGDKAFDEPWELRAFAMAVAAYHEGHYEWNEFQQSLITSIERWESGADGDSWSYYEHWLTALETVLASKGALSEDALDERTRTVLATPKNANHHEAHREPVAVSPARTS